MLRHKSLVPLSRQHQHALALCVQIERKSPVDPIELGEWQVEIARQFEAEIKVHFAVEEEIVFPAARAFNELKPLVASLVSDHQWLRSCFAKAEARQASGEELARFSRKFAEHIRKEERQLFESLQQLMKPEELAQMGRELDRALESASRICSVPNPKQ